MGILYLFVLAVAVGGGGVVAHSSGLPLGWGVGTGQFHLWLFRSGCRRVFRSVRGADSGDPRESKATWTPSASRGEMKSKPTGDASTNASLE